jgi:RNase H-like domain found in reverse transcriptase/Reverse transcriptase (RNA-dependent DNA polymerase)/Integrase zinc binding domain
VCAGKGKVRNKSFLIKIILVSFLGNGFQVGKAHILLFEIGGEGATECLVDSGADANVISERDFRPIEKGFGNGSKMLYDLNYEPTINITGYASPVTLRVMCSFKAWVEVKLTNNEPPKPKTFAEFYVVKGGGRSLMGRATAITMKVLQVGIQVSAIEVVDGESFDEFPSVPGVVIDFDIDDSVQGTHRAYVSIPAHFHEPAMQRIKEMYHSKIIEKVEVPGKWLSGLSAVPKGKGDMRLVVNMMGPNRAITRRVHPMPRFEEIQRKLHGTTVYSKLDLSSAFFHLKLSDRSKEMTAFVAPTESGTQVYQYTRLVFGVNCAPELFQREMERILQGIPGIIIYIDDILIAAKDDAELISTTEIVLARLKANNLTLNESKCEYKRESLTFLGHRVSQGGFNIDDQKVKDVMAFRAPRSGTELKSFLGLANFVRGYIRSFSDMTHPLRVVDGFGKFAWGEEQERAFQRVKHAIANCTITQGYFSTRDKTVLYTDASPYAIGAVLVQVDSMGRERIISFASKSLTETEQRYPQVQRESLAIVWAVEHYHYYTLGAHFTIKTDADGVRFIFNQENPKPRRFLRRAEGWAMRLNTFNYNILFVSGVENIADPSSRLFQSEEPASEYVESEMPCEIANIQIRANEDIVYAASHMPIQEVRMMTTTCQEMQRVIQAMESRQWPDDLQNYESIRDELEIINDVVVKLGVIVLPVGLRAKALNIAHEGHHGMSKTKSMLKEVVWWPKMNHDVDDWVAGCRECILTGRGERPAPMQRTKLPEGSWDYVAMDYCGPFAAFGGVHVIGIVDYFSRFITAAIVKSTSWKHLEPVLEEIFGRWGLPATIKSDNGAPFSSIAYKLYCDQRGIDRVFSFPLNPQQNGMAEASMKHINLAAQHASIGKKPLGDALNARIRAHNDSAHRVTGEVPSQVMMGRHLRRGLPSMLPVHVRVDTEAMRERDSEEKAKKKEYEDARRHAKRPRIEVGDKVVLEREDKRKGESRFDEEELTVQETRRGDLTLVPACGKPIRRDITKVRRLPTPPLVMNAGSANKPQGNDMDTTPRIHWPTTEEDQRPPSPFLSSEVKQHHDARTGSESAKRPRDLSTSPEDEEPEPKKDGRPKRNAQPTKRLHY